MEGQVGKKRKRRSSKAGETKTKKRRLSTPKTSTDSVDEIKFEKKKSRYEQFNTNERYEIALGDPLTTIPEIQSDNVELWVFQFPKNVFITFYFFGSDNLHFVSVFDQQS